MPVRAGTTYRFALYNRGLITDSDTNQTDPVPFYDETGSNPYQLIYKENTDDTTDVAESDDLVNWTVTDQDINPLGNLTVQDHLTTIDGTHYFLTNGLGGTAILKGDSFNNLTAIDTAIDQNDSGGYWDGETAYVLTERDDAGVTSYYQHLWTADDPEGPYTEVGTVIDTSQYGWKTGDAEFLKLDGQIHLFLDHYLGSGNYATARFSPDNSDFTSWTLEDEWATFGGGGDFVPLLVGNRLYGFTEFTGGIGLWREAHVTDGMHVPLTMVQ